MVILDANKRNSVFEEEIFNLYKYLEIDDSECLSYEELAKEYTEKIDNIQFECYCTDIYICR